jgi:hypothetical protein
VVRNAQGKQDRHIAVEVGILTLPNETRINLR